MTLFELFVPRGTLAEAQRRQIAEQIILQVMSMDGAPEAVIERGRAMTQVVVHEPDVWAVGGQLIDPDDAPRYVVRVSVPGGHLSAAMRAELVTRITRVLAEADPDPERLYQESTAWIHIVEIPDGSIAAFGQIIRTADIVKLVVTGERMIPDDTTSDPATPDTAIDPVCGMTVTLSDAAITVEHDGTVYAFCSLACRDLFVAQHGVALSA